MCGLCNRAGFQSRRKSPNSKDLGFSPHFSRGVGTEWAEAQVDTIPLKLLKIGAIVRISVRRIVLQMSSAYPWRDVYARAYRALCC